MDSSTRVPLTWQQLQVGEYYWNLNNPIWIRVQHSGQTTSPPFHHIFTVELRFNYNLRMQLRIKRAWWTIRIWTTLQPAPELLQNPSWKTMISGTLSRRLYFYIHKNLCNLGVISIYNFCYAWHKAMENLDHVIKDYRMENEYISFY
nr:replication enhancer protein [Olea europaea geminivirus]